jgi:hypothetical protein
MDLAWANAKFSLIAVSCDFQGGIAKTQSADYLFYRGQALRLANGLLSVPPVEIADSTFGTVASLCNLYIMMGNLPSEEVHVAGLKQMIMVRRRQITGELQGVVRKIVSW